MHIDRTEFFHFLDKLHQDYGPEVVAKAKRRVEDLFAVQNMFGNGDAQLFLDTKETAECTAKILVHFGVTTGADMQVAQQDHNVFTRMD